MLGISALSNAWVQLFACGRYSPGGTETPQEAVFLRFPHWRRMWPHYLSHRDLILHPFLPQANLFFKWSKTEEIPERRVAGRQSRRASLHKTFLGRVISQFNHEPSMAQNICLTPFSLRDVEIGIIVCCHQRLCGQEEAVIHLPWNRCLGIIWRRLDSSGLVDIPVYPEFSLQPLKTL